MQAPTLSSVRAEIATLRLRLIDSRRALADASNDIRSILSRIHGENETASPESWRESWALYDSRTDTVKRLKKQIYLDLGRLSMLKMKEEALMREAAGETDAETTVEMDPDTLEVPDLQVPELVLGHMLAVGMRGQEVVKADHTVFSINTGDDPVKINDDDGNGVVYVDGETRVSPEGTIVVHKSLNVDIRLQAEKIDCSRSLSVGALECQRLECSECLVASNARTAKLECGTLGVAGQLERPRAAGLDDTISQIINASATTIALGSEDGKSGLNISQTFFGTDPNKGMVSGPASNPAGQQKLALLVEEEAWTEGNQASSSGANQCLTWNRDSGTISTNPSVREQEGELLVQKNLHVNGRVRVKGNLEIASPQASANFQGLLPKGAVIMWPGSGVIPKGWAVCDGKNGTPNLLDRFILCTGTPTEAPSTGGNKSVSLTPDNMPPHRHAVTLSTSESGHHSHFVPSAKIDISQTSIREDHVHNITPGPSTPAGERVIAGSATRQLGLAGDGEVKALNGATQPIEGNLLAEARHTHSIPTDGEHTHYLDISHEHTISQDEDHRHQFVVSKTGEGRPIDLEPPHVQLVMIMKL